MGYNRLVETMTDNPSELKYTPGASLKNASVLMIEEHESNRLAYRMRLERHDAKVILLSSVKEAADYLENTANPKPDLIWLGDTTKNTSARPQFCHWVKCDNTETGKIPLLVVSALGMEGAQQREIFSCVGADAILRKGSFSMDELLQTIDRLLGSAPTVKVTGTERPPATVAPSPGAPDLPEH